MTTEFLCSVSVIIPSYNRTLLTLRAVKSVMAQSVKPLEILIIDDASDIPISEEMLANIQADLCETEIRIIHHSHNQGAAAARNTGINAARGDFIAFLDSDDIWCAGKLETQIESLDTTKPLLGVVCGWHEIRYGALCSNIRIPIAGDSLMLFSSGCWFCPGSTLIIPRAAFEWVGLFDTELQRLEDYEWFLRFAKAGGSLVVSPIGGAVIDIGYRYQTNLVEKAAHDISAKHSAQMPFKARRIMYAYLALQRAAAHWANFKNMNVQQSRITKTRFSFLWNGILQAILLGLQSQRYAPRLRINLKAFWTYKPAPALNAFTQKLLADTGHNQNSKNSAN